jgi:hypothetical protein
LEVGNKGGEKASREYPECLKKRILEDKETELLSTRIAFVSFGISKIAKSLLKVWTSGDIPRPDVKKIF